MFGALRLECDQHVSRHREKHAGIEVEVNKRKDRQLDFGTGITLSTLSLVDVMITHDIGEI